MPRLFDELAFSPSVQDLLTSQNEKHVTVLTGLNNSGKSAYLKKMSYDRSKLYIGVNRFYSFHHMGLYSKNDAELDNWYINFNDNIRREYQNFEGSFFNTSTALARLSDSRREQLFRVFRDLFGQDIAVQAEVADNQFSNRYISIDGESLSVTSSGTRLFLGVLAGMMDERFSVALDEPELGLSPTLQARLARIVVQRDYAEELFPHHPHFVLSTHSHVFLDKSDPTNNFVVSRKGNLITAERCQSFQQLMDIQFRMLGNDLGNLFLPDAIFLVEGDTDKLYLAEVLRLKLPGFRVVVESCGGNIASRLHYWASALGDFNVSPYRSRTFLVYDSVEQAGLEKVAQRLGIPAQSMVRWDRNGIEYVYPLDILSSVFRAAITDYDGIAVEGDRIWVGDIAVTKMDLAQRVVAALNPETKLPDELMSKLIEPVRRTLTV
jgi:predicted ATPase